MILALDAGNTNIVLGIVEHDTVLFSARLATDRSKTEDEYAVFFKNILELHNVNPRDIHGGIISSVVPPLTHVLKRAIELVSGTTPLVVGPGVKTGLNILIDNPKQLGSDLVVDAVAALAEYPAPLILLDMGTATTFSAIDARGNFLGVVILPGVRVSQEALSSRTSQLPHISMEAPDHVIGRNTTASMQSGMVYGQASMVDGMIDRIQEELGGTATVIATGGLSRQIIPHCRHKILYDNDLLIKGLLLIYKRNTR